MIDRSETVALLTAWKAELNREVLEIKDRLDDEPPKDWEDRASERQGDEVLEALGAHDVSELRQIEAALDRLENGTYGVCARCSSAIPEKRLKALPATPLCARCAS